MIILQMEKEYRVFIHLNKIKLMSYSNDSQSFNSKILFTDIIRLNSILFNAHCFFIFFAFTINKQEF